LAHAAREPGQPVCGGSVLLSLLSFWHGTSPAPARSPARFSVYERPKRRTDGRAVDPVWVLSRTMKALKAATQLLLPLPLWLLLFRTGHACGTFIEIQAKRAGGKAKMK